MHIFPVAHTTTGFCFRFSPFLTEVVNGPRLKFWHSIGFQTVNYYSTIGNFGELASVESNNRKWVAPNNTTLNLYVTKTLFTLDGSDKFEQQALIAIIISLLN